VASVLEEAPVAQKARRSVHRTQWAAQFAVASELCKRGYEVAFTMGNHPSKDLLAVSPKGISFSIDVKGLYRPNWWIVTPKPPHLDLYYVFAYVPDQAPNRFFIFTQEEVNAEITAALEADRVKAEQRGRVSKFDQFPSVGWAAAEKHENAWGVLPA
jgi:hypothetical protein